METYAYPEEIQFINETRESLRQNIANLLEFVSVEELNELFDESVDQAL